MTRAFHTITACFAFAMLGAVFFSSFGCASTESSGSEAKPANVSTGSTSGHNVYTVPTSREGLRKVR